MNYHRRGLCPGSGEKSTRLSFESGMRRYNHRQNTRIGVSTTSAINGFSTIANTKFT